jgi:hypothetical protein
MNYRFGITTLSIALLSAVLSIEAQRMVPLQSRVESTELAGIRGGQPGPVPYPPGPGGPCADGISWLCEQASVSCINQECKWSDFQNNYICSSPWQIVQNSFAWTQCSTGWPSGMTQCAQVTWVCAFEQNCDPNSKCNQDPTRGNGRYCSYLGDQNIRIIHSNGGALQGDNCP